MQEDEVWWSSTDTLWMLMFVTLLQQTAWRDSAALVAMDTSQIVQLPALKLSLFNVIVPHTNPREKANSPLDAIYVLGCKCICNTENDDA
jgi:hypothetical protein